jgi:hypothetical protein
LPRVPAILALLLTALPAAASGPEALLPLPSQLAPLAPDGATVLHTADSLWEKINGEAEQYRRFGVRRSASAYFTLPDDPMRGVEISLFDMGSPLGAFGMYAAYRSPSVPRMEAGNDGSFSDRQAMFWQGRHFVLIDGFGPDETRAEDLRGALAAVAARLGPVPPRPSGLEAFERIAVPGSVLYIPDHLLGRDAMPPGFEGRSADGVRIFASLTAPRVSSSAYRGLLESTVSFRLPGGDGYSGTDPVQGEVTVVFRKGGMVGLLAPLKDPSTIPLLTRLLTLLSP